LQCAAHCDYSVTMKHLFGVAIVLLLAFVPAANAEGPDDQYVGIYDLIQQGDALNENGQFPAALKKYQQAQSDLSRFKNANPDWNVKVVAYRERYLAARIAILSSEIPAATAVATTPPNTPAVSPPPVTVPVTPPAPVVTTPAPPPVPATPPIATLPPVNNADAIIKSLQDQLRQEDADRAMLQAKLREALGARPAAVDPQELTDARTQIRSLLKENELLKVSMEQNQGTRSSPDVAAVEQTRKELALAKQQTDDLTQANAMLSVENGKLQARLKERVAPDSETTALREENAVLKKQVTELKKPSPAGGDVDRKLAEAQAQIAALRSDKEILRLEQVALENRVKQLQAAAPVTTVQTDDASAAKIKELEAERDNLQMRLDAALRQISGVKPDASAQARVDDTSRQLDALRSRIEILEAHPSPYTPEELSLLSTTQGTELVAAVHHGGPRSVRELSTASLALLAEAKKDAANQDFAGSEAKYLELAKANPRNPAVLADLASVQVNLNHTSGAETNIMAALALDPDNAYEFFVLGRVKLAESKFNDALEALSRAAQIDPNDAQIQNNLGVALSEKGLRVPAEAALRRAVQIDPGCADAHANLAFVYITQQPPLVELARWHYEKALAAGHPHIPGIEKLLDQNKTTGPAQ
jgi:tetratricopeptide (TPR) repeat protein